MDEIIKRLFGFEICLLQQSLIMANRSLLGMFQNLRIVNAPYHSAYLSRQINKAKLRGYNSFSMPTKSIS